MTSEQWVFFLFGEQVLHSEERQHWLTNHVYHTSVSVLWEGDSREDISKKQLWRNLINLYLEEQVIVFTFTIVDGVSKKSCLPLRDSYCEKNFKTLAVI